MRSVPSSTGASQHTQAPHLGSRKPSHSFTPPVAAANTTASLIALGSASNRSRPPASSICTHTCAAATQRQEQRQGGRSNAAADEDSMCGAGGARDTQACFKGRCNHVAHCPHTQTRRKVPSRCTPPTHTNSKEGAITLHTAHTTQTQTAPAHLAARCLLPTAGGTHSLHQPAGAACHTHQRRQAPKHLV